MQWTDGSSPIQRAANTRDQAPAREKQHVSVNVSHTPAHVVSTCHYLSGRFASGTAVAEQFPTWALRADLPRPASPILAVVPLDEVSVDFGHRSESSQDARLPGALKGACKYLGKHQSLQPVC